VSGQVRPCQLSDARAYVSHFWPVDDHGHALIGDPRGDEIHEWNPYMCENCHQTFEDCLVVRPTSRGRCIGPRYIPTDAQELGTAVIVRRRCWLSAR
jgi:hypothetical protein